MDDISGLWESFSLNDTEVTPFDFGLSEDDNQFYLAARFMTTRVLNIESIVRTFRPLWRTHKGFSARDMGNNMVVFTFEDEADMVRVIQSEPWSYDKHLVAFQRVEADTAIEEVECSHVSFWVQLYNLPVRRMNKEAVMALVCTVGSVEQVSESDAERGREGCMRARVRLDILRPLSRGRKARRADGTELWISFKYERLPNFCYWCGRLTHAEKDCDLWLRSKGTLRRESQQYGAWLRAPMDKPMRRVEVRAEGRSNVPHWGQPQTQSPSPQSAVSPSPVASGGSSDDTTGPGLGIDPSKEKSAQNPEMIRSSVDNLEQHLREIDLALKSPPISSGLSRIDEADQSMPLEPNLSRNIQDPVINASVNSYATKKQSEGAKSPRVILEEINPNGLMKGGPKQKNKPTKKSQSVNVNPAHLSPIDKENIPIQTPHGLDSDALHEVDVQVDVQEEARGKWKRIHRTKDHLSHPGAHSLLAGTKRGGAGFEMEGGVTGQMKKGRNTECSLEQNMDGDLAVAGVQPRRTQ